MLLAFLLGSQTVILTVLLHGKVSGLDFVPVVVLKNEPELSCLPAEGILFSKSLKGVPVFKNIWDKYMTKSYYPVSLLSVISKVFQKLVNNRLFDHLKKCDFFCFLFLVFF